MVKSYSHYYLLTAHNLGKKFKYSAATHWLRTWCKEIPALWLWITITMWVWRVSKEL